MISNWIRVKGGYCKPSEHPFGLSQFAFSFTLNCPFFDQLKPLFIHSAWGTDLIIGMFVHGSYAERHEPKKITLPKLNWGSFYFVVTSELEKMAPLPPSAPCCGKSFMKSSTINSSTFICQWMKRSLKPGKVAAWE